MHPDRIDRLPRYEVTTVSDISGAADSLLHAVFHTRSLCGIPIAWGGSSATLERKMKEVQSLQNGARVTLQDVVAEGPGQYRITGANPIIIFDVSSWGMAGWDAGILSFDFNCEENKSPPLIEFYWASNENKASNLTMAQFHATNGRLLVPLDAAPAWLLAERIEKVYFKVASMNVGRVFRISDIRFLQRLASQNMTIKLSKPVPFGIFQNKIF
jgi:hypothetical protein